MNPDFESPFLDAEMPSFPADNGQREMPPELEGGSEGALSAESAATEMADRGEEFESEWNPGLFNPAELESLEAEDEWEFTDPQAEWTSSSGEELEGEDSFGETFDQSEWEPEPEAAEEPGEGEVILLNEEMEEGEGQIILLDHEGDELDQETVPTSLNMRKPTPVLARILWPALGFPAVIAPRPSASGSPMTEGDATRCITVLLLTDRKYLSKEEAARYLRYVPWDQRGRRHLGPKDGGSFEEVELAVRNDEAGPKLVLDNPKDRLSTVITFGGRAGGQNTIVVSLANRVREIYGAMTLKYLHEIRVSEAASARLADGQYHLFWNNESSKEDAPSDEMALLLANFAKPRRKKLDKKWAEHEIVLLREYEYEYGPLHLPYLKQRRPLRRAEVLHPLFVDRGSHKNLKIGHLTDMHVDIRADVYEENLRRAPTQSWGGKKPSYNNWNTSFTQVYEKAKEDSDVLLLTGDLIDYGRGHFGPTAHGRLGDNRFYHVDRNWFLFYDLLAAGTAYQKPAYTILGNHDWRLNPYPPFAIAGAPNPRLLINNSTDFSKEQQKDILRTAHGPRYDPKFSYDPNAGAVDVASGVAYLVRLLGQTKTLDHPGLPTATTVESVLWYLLSINPFFDYSFPLPSGHRILMLDWAEDEDVLFPVVAQGKEGAYVMPWDKDRATDPGPKAKRCLTPLQKWLTQEFIRSPGAAKIVGIHAPPIGPYGDWDETVLAAGRKTYDRIKDARGPLNYGLKKPDGTIERWNGHPLFAVRPPDKGYGMEADYNSFVENRPWFIQEVAKPDANIRLVFSGHIHRNGLFVVPLATREEGTGVAGQLLVHSIAEVEARGAHSPAVTHTRKGKQGPLYVNTTSAGPRGNSYPTKGQYVSVDPGFVHVELSNDGTIQRVDFWPPQTRPVPAAQPEVAYQMG